MTHDERILDRFAPDVHEPIVSELQVPEQFSSTYLELSGQFTLLCFLVLGRQESAPPIGRDHYLLEL